MADHNLPSWSLRNYSTPNQALVFHNDCPFTGEPAEGKAAPKRPALRLIAINLGSGSRLQSGEGFVTHGHPVATAQGDYKTPTSGEWALFNSATSANQACQVLQFEAFESWTWLSPAILDLNSNHPDMFSTHILSIIE